MSSERPDTKLPSLLRVLQLANVFIIEATKPPPIDPRIGGVGPFYLQARATKPR